MLPGLLAGLGLSGGVFLLVRGLVPARPPLGAVLAHLDGADGGPPSLLDRLVGASDGGALRVTGRSPQKHALDKVVAAVAFAGLPVAAAALAAGGGVAVPVGLVAVAALGLGPVGFVVPELLLRTEARERRRDFRHALGAYLDLVTVLVAGGSGPESALHTAVEAGEGWPFEELAAALDTARLAGEAPWAALSRLGEELGVPELVELAANVGLAGEQGAKVRASLAAKAASIREHELAEAEAEAQSATERMAVPVVLMLFGFVVFVGYPAVQRVLTDL